MAAGVLFPRPLNGDRDHQIIRIPAVSRWFNNQPWSQAFSGPRTAGTFSMSKNDKGRLPQFVPLLKGTMATPAWRATSHGARWLYVALKLRYSSNFKNNGRNFFIYTRCGGGIGIKPRFDP